MKYKAAIPDLMGGLAPAHEGALRWKPGRSSQQALASAEDPVPEEMVAFGEALASAAHPEKAASLEEALASASDQEEATGDLPNPGSFSDPHDETGRLRSS